jgi:hypothetical protein
MPALVSRFRNLRSASEGGAGNAIGSDFKQPAAAHARQSWKRMENAIRSRKKLLTGVDKKSEAL